MKNILVPTDFSEQARFALDFAKELAIREGAQITLLHSLDTSRVFSPLYMDPSLTVHMLKDLETQAREKLRELQEKQGNKVHIEAVTKSCALIDAIEAVSEERHVDLIVMGTQGASGLKEFLVGSNTERVLRTANAPVFTIPAPFSVRDVKKIVVPVDYTKVSERFMIELHSLQQIFDASLEFLWIKTHHFIGNEGLLHNNFMQYVRSHFTGDFNIHRRLDFTPESCILQFSMEIGADVIAMETSQRKGIDHLFLGSTTENVANHAPIPVVGFPMKHHDRLLKLGDEEHAEFGEFIL